MGWETFTYRVLSGAAELFWGVVGSAARRKEIILYRIAEGFLSSEFRTSAVQEIFQTIVEAFSQGEKLRRLVWGWFIEKKVQLIRRVWACREFASKVPCTVRNRPNFVLGKSIGEGRNSVSGRTFPTERYLNLTCNLLELLPSTTVFALVRTLVVGFCTLVTAHELSAVTWAVHLTHMC